jgi:hypothetical protein
MISQLPACPVNRNFKVAIYVCVSDLHKAVADPAWLENSFQLLSRYIHIDKVYFETYRNEKWVDKDIILFSKNFFESKGVKVSGGITYVVSEEDFFQTFCYTRPEQRQKVQAAAELAASMFDEVLLDDFFFTNCKCEACIAAKGDRSWTEYRLELMRDAAQNLLVGPAKKINPKIRFNIKYPNWYDHFQNCGFDLELEPGIFDGIYSGTETRDPVYTHQHLQRYESYAIFRYFENIAPGRNGGGWVDPYRRRTLDGYAEQLALTLFAKAPEVTLFRYSDLFETLQRADGTHTHLSAFAPVAGHTFNRADVFLGSLGQPVGVKTYKPFHSHGEDFLPNYLGMLGIPMDITPHFPADACICLLTEQARFDPAIVEKIKQQLAQGKQVMITSGLLRELQGKGFEAIVELEYTGQKALVRRFHDWRAVYPAERELLIPQIRYATNDAWELITALDSASGTGYPILQRVDYGPGRMYVLTIPENMGDLYAYPQPVVNAIKQILLKDFIVYVDSPDQVSLFVYDNDTFIVASFQEYELSARIVMDQRFTQLVELPSGQTFSGQIEGEKRVFHAQLLPHQYLVFKAVEGVNSCA